MTADLKPAFAGLTERQQTFCEHILLGVPRKAAAVAAGYKSDIDGYRVFKLPIVQEALAKARQITADACARDREFMDKKLEEAWHNAVNSTEQVAVIREWKKLHGLDAPTKIQHQHEGEIKHVAELRDMSTAELRKLAACEAPAKLPAPAAFDLEGEFEVVGG